MQINGKDNLHLTYCTNVHPGESWDEVQANLQRYLPALKSKLCPNQPFGIGLRLSARAAFDILKSQRLNQLQSWLANEGLYVFSLNGFPYGGFHGQIIKEKVFAYGWETRQRVNYTLLLGDILAAIVPDGVEGSISTLPVSYKSWTDDSDAKNRSVVTQSAMHLAFIATRLAEIQRRTGKLLHIDLEPEPGCVLENSEDMCRFFNDTLIPIGVPIVQEALAVSASAAEACLRNYIRVCYDACHFALQYEQPGHVFKRFAQEGISIGKIQLSSALKVLVTGTDSQRADLVRQLGEIDEPVYLHQVIEREASGHINTYSDLPQAMSRILDGDKEWRIHFHVPLFIEHYQSFTSTQSEVVKVIEEIKSHSQCRHLEIETYTWEVLPSVMKIDLLSSIEQEYRWVMQQFVVLEESRQ